MTTASIFKNGKNQAIRIPKDMEFDVKTVTIKKVGDKLIIEPIRPSWESLLDTPPLVDEDFLKERPDLYETDRVKFDE